MQANAIVGVDFDYEVFGEGGMMMVSVTEPRSFSRAAPVSLWLELATS